MRRRGTRIEDGALLVELLVALILLTIGSLAVLGSFSVAFRGIQETEELDIADVAIENVSEILWAQPVDTVYAGFHGATFPVEDLESPDGGTAMVTVNCFVNEGTIPAEFGPLTDLDGNPTATSADVSTSYRLLPTRVSVDYLTSRGLMTREVFLVLGGGI